MPPYECAAEEVCITIYCEIISCTDSVNAQKKQNMGSTISACFKCNAFSIECGIIAFSVLVLLLRK